MSKTPSPSDRPPDASPRTVDPPRKRPWLLAISAVLLAGWFAFLLTMFFLSLE